MNLAYTKQVLSAHRWAVVIGLVLALLAAVFVYGRPGLGSGGPTLTARTPQVWKSSSVLFLTQKGFPWGRADAAASGTDENRFSDLAVLYAQLATSDPVLARAGVGDTYKGDITAEPVIYEIGRFNTPVVLPMVRLSATANTPAAASTWAQRVSQALREYVASGQVGAKIKRNQRVLIQSSRAAEEPTLVSGPSKALPIVVFVVLLGLVLMSVFGYHNYRTNSAIPESQGPRPLEEARAAPVPSVGERTPRRQPSATQAVSNGPALGDVSQADAFRAQPSKPGRVLSAEGSSAIEEELAEVPSVRAPRQR